MIRVLVLYDDETERDAACAIVHQPKPSKNFIAIALNVSGPLKIKRRTGRPGKDFERLQRVLSQ